ncbi:MAG TPA: ubiquitin-like domain-containing protein [Syntrophothermus lipocalidus]|uniref:3D domain protein n=1 Tax=Syntrophothermus lipocalidus (strain DSM 12680 / TGB-C1) TaxID=643648 RepID=D7CIJ8_SYNLT|nr:MULTISPECIES: 3D domain-containing protein [Syntrophothermus]ADI00863.1 3D domain protein [Syntrophothermus lipocalidus DSM 12680]NSW83367.1 DUF348 domain-containing protein [Syntrophothermus sp.]HOV43617.1 ubiquitin-like domain-containing protein [Syntrophothermus lipocalidus]
MLFLRSKQLAFWLALVFMVAFLGGLLFWLEKDVTIAVDGKLVRTLTFKQTVQDVLEQEGIKLGPKDVVKPGLDTRLEKGSRIQVIRAFNVKVLADGRVRQILTTPVTVAQALKVAGIGLGDEDIVTPKPDVVIKKGQDIRVVRVSHQVITANAVIPYPVQRTADNTLEKGLTKTVRRGQNGLAVDEIKITYHDGKETGREVIGRTIVKDPVPQVIAMGTITSVSRGNLRLDFDRAMIAEATAYTYTGSRTSSGAYPEVGLVAVDPSVIPMGTRLYVEGYGFARAADCGSDIKGNRIDVFMETESQCRSWGRRTVKVYVLE